MFDLDRACSEVLEGVLAFESGRLQGWTAANASWAGADATPDARLAFAFADVWNDLLHDRTAGLEEKGKTLFATAAARKAAAAVIDATALRALIADTLGDAEAALALARRASLMARTEAVPDVEILANIVLARARRRGGQPHLAVRILTALFRVASARFLPWLWWELLMSGGARSVEKARRGRSESPDEQGSAMRAARALERLLEAASRGDRQNFLSSADETRRLLSGWPLMRREAETAIALLDLESPADDVVAAWRNGSTGALPGGMQGIALPVTGAEPGEIVLAYVHGGPRAGGVRLVRAGVALLPGGHEAVRANAARRGAGGRTETGLAVLALAGPAGMKVEDFFRAVYGFGFSALMHTTVLEVLLHRMRRRLAAFGELTKSGDEVALTLAQPMMFPDPRCALPVTGRVLEVLAARGVVDASDAALTLGIPLRTIQGALKQLVADGACRTQRVGKLVHYRLEDTTFSEPTSAAARVRT